MPVTVLDPTVAGTASNTYGTLAEAEQYALDRRPVPTAWNAASADDKNAALLMATRRLQQETWRGSPYRQYTQKLSWPRFGVYDIDGYAILTYASEIPDFVKRAQFELAFALLADNIVDNTGLEPFTDLQAGPVRVVPDKGFRAYPLPESCIREIAHVLRSGGSSSRLVRA